MIRQCKKCENLYDLSEFKKQAGCKHGVGYVCKLCANSREAARMRTPEGREGNRRKAKTEAFRRAQAKFRKSDKRKAILARYNAKNAEKLKARSAVNHAIRDGKLPDPTTLRCECGKSAMEYHHHKGYDESNRLEVIPVCVECHGLDRRNTG